MADACPRLPEAQGEGPLSLGERVVFDHPLASLAGPRVRQTAQEQADGGHQQASVRGRPLPGTAPYVGRLRWLTVQPGGGGHRVSQCDL